MDTLYSRMKPYLGDEAELIERMAGRLDLWEECVKLFPREELLQAIEKALEAGDYEGLYAELHRLKGNLANFGFVALAAKTAVVLKDIKEQNTEQIRTDCLDVQREYAELIERIGDCDET